MHPEDRKIHSQKYAFPDSYKLSRPRNDDSTKRKALKRKIFPKSKNNLVHSSLYVRKIHKTLVHKPIPLAILDIKEKQTWTEDDFLMSSSGSSEENKEKIIHKDPNDWSGTKFSFLIKFKETVPASVHSTFLKDVHSKSWQEGLPIEWSNQEIKAKLEEFKEKLESMPGKE